MQKKKDISRRINYDVVSSLLTTDISGKGRSKQSKSRASNREGKKSESAKRVSGLFDDADLSGLERMETTDDEALSWTGGKRSDPEITFHDDDGYGSDDYQQEA
jgi:hypothetical protein